MPWIPYGGETFGSYWLDEEPVAAKPDTGMDLSSVFGAYNIPINIGNSDAQTLYRAVAVENMRGNNNAVNTLAQIFGVDPASVMSDTSLWNSPAMQNYAAQRVEIGNQENMLADLLQGAAWVGGGALGINNLIGANGLLTSGGGYIDALGGMTDSTGTALSGWTDLAGELAADFGGVGSTAADLLGTGTTAATTAATMGTLGSIGGSTAAADAAAGLLTTSDLGAMGVSPLAQYQMGFTGLGNLASGTGSYLSNLVGGAAGTAGTVAGTAGAAGVSGSIWPSVISGGLNLAGGLLSADAASDAADKQAATQLAIADMMRFRPVGVTTRFGSSQFGYDPATGNLTSAGYTLSPETKALQDSLMGAAPGLLSQFTGSQAATAPMGTAAQAAMNLGNQYLATSPQAQAQKYMDEQMALLQPQNERALAALEAKLQAQGRLGLATGGTSTLAASNPELEALMNAQKMQQLQLAAAATQGGMDYAKFGTAMAGAGGDLLNSMYGTQVAAFNPYNTALTGANTLEGMGQQAMNLGTTLGAQQTTANTPAANLMGQAAATQAAGNAVSPWGALLSGAGNAIQNYQTQQQQQQYQNNLLAALTKGNSVIR